MGISNDSDWYKKARNNLLEQKKVIYETSDKEMPGRYHRYCEVLDDLERLEKWRKACSTSFSP